MACCPAFKLPCRHPTGILKFSYSHFLKHGEVENSKLFCGNKFSRALPKAVNGKQNSTLAWIEFLPHANGCDRPPSDLNHLPFEVSWLFLSSAATARAWARKSLQASTCRVREMDYGFSTWVNRHSPHSKQNLHTIYLNHWWAPFWILQTSFAAWEEISSMESSSAALSLKTNAKV